MPALNSRWGKVCTTVDDTLDAFVQDFPTSTPPLHSGAHYERGGQHTSSSPSYRRLPRGRASVAGPPTLPGLRAPSLSLLHFSRPRVQCGPHQAWLPGARCPQTPGVAPCLRARPRFRATLNPRRSGARAAPSRTPPPRKLGRRRARTHGRPGLAPRPPGTRHMRASFFVSSRRTRHPAREPVPLAVRVASRRPAYPLCPFSGLGLGLGLGQAQGQI
jgi:hypothetical protein